MGSRIVLRSNLSDMGKTAGRARYFSPDIITHTQVLESQKFFTENYSSDPNMGMEPKNHNCIYLRAKNVGDADSEKQYANLYVNDYCLYNNPQTWEQHRVKTVSGESYSELGVIKPGDIAVTTDYFWYNPSKYNGKCCFVGTVGPEPTPDYGEINSWSKFTRWLDANPGAATRNMLVSDCYEVRDYEDIVHIDGLGQSAIMMFVVKAENLPDNTYFGIRCDAVSGLEKEQKYVAGDEQTHEFVQTVRIPTNFDDYLTSYGRLPAGSSGWPDNAVIMVSASIVQTRVSISQFLPLRNLQLMKLRHDKIGVASSRDEIEELLPGFYADEPKLGIPIGGCGHKFITCA